MNATQSALTVKRLHEKDILTMRNVVAVGVGYKVRGGERTNEIGIIVSVVRKVPASDLPPSELVPKELLGVPTDVIETGEIHALALDPKLRYRPARPGISIGHHAITAGTFGCLARKGQTVILSNNHVLANSNNAKPGDAVYQPGPADGGTAADALASLVEFAPIAFNDIPWPPPIPAGCNPLARRAVAVKPYNAPGNNRVDCAIALPTHPADVIPNILNLDHLSIPRGVMPAELGLLLAKSGRTTGMTEGEVTQVDVTASVNYGGPIAVFTGQIMAGAMSAGGDSGSLVQSFEGFAVGLLFAGSQTTTLMNPIVEVLIALGIDLVTEPL